MAYQKNNEKLFWAYQNMLCTTYGEDWKKVILGTKQLGFADVMGSDQQGG